jgi:hypothetical protein
VTKTDASLVKHPRSPGGGTLGYSNSSGLMTGTDGQNQPSSGRAAAGFVPDRPELATFCYRSSICRELGVP